MDESDRALDKEIVGQGVFVSTFTRSLDPKRRLTIPSGWRAQVGEPKSLYVLPAIHAECLKVVPAGVMMERTRRMRQHSMGDQRAQQFARVLGSQADLVAWDAQGRIRIKDELMDFAGIGDQVALVGTFETFEVWSPERFEKEGGMDRTTLQEAAAYVGL